MLLLTPNWAAGHLPGMRKGLTVSEVLEDWFENVASRTSKRSALETNRGYLDKRIKPAVGAILVEQLAVSDLDKAYRGWLTDPNRPLSASTVRKLHAILSAAFGSALKRGLIDRDVTKVTTPPAAARFVEDPLDVEEVRAILATARKGDSYARWLVALMLGLRQGECLGLQWKHVHLDDSYIDVSESLGRRKWQHGCTEPCGRRAASCPSRHAGGLLTTTPKSGKSREVALPASVIEALNQQRESQNVARAVAGSEWTEQGFVFTNPLGGPIDPKRDHLAWKALLESAGVRSVRLHNARHSAGTIMGSLGIPLRDIQEAFGHSSAKVTERYVHIKSESQRRAAAKMDAALFGDRATEPEPERIETTIETSMGRITFAKSGKGENPSQNESRLGDLNPGPTHYECVALPLS